MSNKDAISKHLESRGGKPICDDCLGDDVHIDRHTVNSECNGLDGEGAIVRDEGYCSNCRKAKLVNRWPVGDLDSDITVVLRKHEGRIRVFVRRVHPGKRWWNGLKKMIEGQMNHGQAPSEIVFRCGGTVPISDWFKNWCKQNGITIRILDGPEFDVMLANDGEER